MLLARRQSARDARYFLPCQSPCLFNRHSFKHLRQHRAASQGRRAPVSEKTRGFNSSIAHTQTETQAITAHRIRLFCDGGRVRQLADVSWIG